MNRGQSVAALNIADPAAAEKADKAQDEATKDTKGDSISAGKNSETKSDASTTDSTTDATKTDAAKSEETESVADKFQALPQTTKVAIYAGAGTGAAVIIAAFLFVCIRQRRKGREERDAYNAQVEKDREAAYQDQLELREKGLGGWDKNAYAQGEDALGGWNSNAASSTDKFGGSAVSAQAVPLVRAGSESPGSPRITPAWAGGNQGGMIHNAQNSYTGGYNPSSNSSAYGSNQNIPRSPNFPLASQTSYNSQGGFPPASNAGFGTTHNGYQRF